MTVLGRKYIRGRYRVVSDDTFGNADRVLISVCIFAQIYRGCSRSPSRLAVDEVRSFLHLLNSLERRQEYLWLAERHHL